MAATGSRRWLILLLTAALLAACTTAAPDRDEDAPAARTPPATADDPDAGDDPDTGDPGRAEPDGQGAEGAGDFHTPPDPLPPGGPGTLVRTEEVPADPDRGDGARVWRVLYRSESIAGEPTATSGLVFRPAGPAPKGGFPVLSWAHGTVGAADACAPSRAPGPRPGALRPLLDAGFVVAATDYEGLGTPGVHPYLVGDSAGRSVLDAARAAHLVDGADAGGPVIVAGSSQGGHAALFAAEIAPDYAPDLALAGTVAAAAPSDLVALVDRASAEPSAFGFALTAIATWGATYPGADPADILTPQALQRARLVEEVCTAELFGTLLGDPIGALLSADPREVEPWDELVHRNSAGATAPRTPLLLVHGTDDRVVPVTQSEKLHERLCARGAPAELFVVDGAGHGEEFGVVFDRVEEWIAARLAGEPAAGCPA